MKKALTPTERLIIAADFKPDPLKFRNSQHYLCAGAQRHWVRTQVLALADILEGTGVYLKVNSALRACGYDLIHEIHARGLRVFADLKLFDISETLSTDGVLLQEAKPELLTTCCAAGILAMKALKDQLPSTEVLGVTVLTSLNSADTNIIHGGSIQDSVRKLAEQGIVAGIGGFISSPYEIKDLRDLVGDTMTINTPAIRPTWAIVSGDDQNPDRIMTPAKAIAAGADRIVVGRPIIKAEKPYDAVMRTIEEIASATT